MITGTTTSAAIAREIRDDLAGLACELNSVLHLLGPCDLCVPWFYARIDPARRQLQYVNAGHEAPLLIRHGGVERLERTGAALGLSMRGLHRQKAARIETGDLLAIFSEAVSEDEVLRVVGECPQAVSYTHLTLPTTERV